MSEEDLQNIPELLGENVRKYRKQAGLTQEELSERLGLTQKHLSVIDPQIISRSLGIGRILLKSNLHSLLSSFINRSLNILSAS